MQHVLGYGGKPTEHGIECPKTISPVRMKASLHARFATKVSRTAAYEAPSTGIFYRTDLSPSSVCKVKIRHLRTQHRVEVRFCQTFRLQAKRTDPRIGSCYDVPLNNRLRNGTTEIEPQRRWVFESDADRNTKPLTRECSHPRTVVIRDKGSVHMKTGLMRICTVAP
jgi:hypothetical protein